MSSILCTTQIGRDLEPEERGGESPESSQSPHGPEPYPEYVTEAAIYGKTLVLIY